MEVILGVAMLVSWGWAFSILFNRLGETNTAEKWILGFATTTLLLFIIGSMME